MKPLSSLALALALGACVPGTPTYLTAPADPAVGTRSPRYAAVTGGVRSYGVVEPLDWRELNRRVAPGDDAEKNESNDAARRGR